MNGPDYRTAAEYFRDKAHAAKREVLDGTDNPPATTNKCAHRWRVTHEGMTYCDCRCDLCGETKRESWD